MEPDLPPSQKKADDGTTISIIILVLLTALGIYYVPQLLVPRRIKSSQSSQLHTLDLALFAYAEDHGNAYPTGKSSTEVFQKLLDEGYVTDPAIYYFAMPGKVKATSKILKPENICWDVTVPAKLDDADELPLVFGTGYRVIYAPGGDAVPITRSSRSPGIFVCYKNNSSKFAKEDGLPDHIVKHVIDPGFNPKGRTYRQLTPDGPLPP